jgi:hypothetical protein
MPSGFGYHKPGTQPTPDPRMVGQMLMQRGQTGGTGGTSQMGQAQQPQAPVTDDRQHHEAPAHSRDEMLRREGGKLMGSGGSDDDGALSAAVGEALTRAGGGHRANPNPHKDRTKHIRQLQQLGISEVEAMLLGETL